MFPHHENEIAQSEACTGKTFSRFWMHSEHLLVDGKKMSKSLGNFYTLRDLLEKGYKGREVRYLLLSTHYRTQLNFTFEGLDAARQSLKRIDDFVLRLKHIATESDNSITGFIDDFKNLFKESLGEDLNISAALAALFDFIRKINTYIDGGSLGKTGAAEILTLFANLDTVLSILLQDEESVPLEIEEKAKLRHKARHDKDFKLADTYRKEIDASGYIVEDSPAGYLLKRK